MCYVIIQHLFFAVRPEDDGISTDNFTNDCVSVQKEDIDDYYEYDIDFKTITDSPCTERKGFVCEACKFCLPVRLCNSVVDILGECNLL